MKKLYMLAFDLGASNGRAVSGAFDGERIALHRLHGFDNQMVCQNGLYYWNALGLLRELKAGFLAYAKSAEAPLSSFGIDTWGVDFGLLDSNGGLLGNPRCYRNATVADVNATHEIIDKRTLFERTGIASEPFNTVYQLHRRARENDAALYGAKTLLFMPDLYSYFLTGEKNTEYTIATTSMLYNGKTRSWDTETMKALNIPEHIFTAVDSAGTFRGKLLADIAEETGVGRVPAAVVGTHDTASAVASIPGKGSFAFCSSGTWSLFGVETDAPVLSEAVYNANFSNEGTVQGGFRPLKNIMGLWLIQECRREWQREGKDLSWDDVVELAKMETPFRSIINVDSEPFYSAGNMTDKIRDYCIKSGQAAPETVGQFARCIYESLALKYRQALENMEIIKGCPIDTLNIVGGGTQNRLLNQFAANAIARPVITGPTEGSCAGNLLMQAVALGELKDVHEAREVVRRSFETQTYFPACAEIAAWDDAYNKLLAISEKTYD